jgi:hypothetical protein
MTTFEYKLGRLAAHTTMRTGYAEEARRRTHDGSLFTIDNYIVGALSLARDVHGTFAEDFGTPIPPPVEYAMRTEINAWERLHVALLDFREARPAPHEIPAYATNVRQFLTYQIDLLDTERELLTSCLTDHYLQRIDALKAKLDEVTL